MFCYPTFRANRSSDDGETKWNGIDRHWDNCRHIDDLFWTDQYILLNTIQCAIGLDRSGWRTEIFSGFRFFNKKTSTFQTNVKNSFLGFAIVFTWFYSKKAINILLKNYIYITYIISYKVIINCSLLKILVISLFGRFLLQIFVDCDVTPFKIEHFCQNW